MNEKIPCEYGWSDGFVEPSSVSVEWDEGVGYLTIEGVGDGTLTVCFAKENWNTLALAVDDVLWELFPEDQQNTEEG
jgi:hypothetical protein